MLDIWVVTDAYEYETTNFTHITESGARKNGIERIVSILWNNRKLLINPNLDDTSGNQLVVSGLKEAGVGYKMVSNPYDDDPQLNFEGMDLEALRTAYKLLSERHWDIANYGDVGCVEIEKTRLSP